MDHEKWANPQTKVKGNVPGKYYVDAEFCLVHAMCAHLAPRNFTTKGETGLAYVFKQPETEAEEQACHDALLSCPVGAIGNDGLTEEFGESG